MGVLTVVLKQIKHLRDEDTFGKSDPYVEFELEQDNFFFDKDLGQKKSSKKKGEVNPVYNETFKWENVRSTNNLKLDVKGKFLNEGGCMYDGVCPFGDVSNLPSLFLSP